MTITIGRNLSETGEFHLLGSHNGRVGKMGQRIGDLMVTTAHEATAEGIAEIRKIVGPGTALFSIVD